ncbi:phage distal tail protein [Amycolatopsis taiwanensis]|uniref:phage distal tail protein n=1 Tax=Amycolatopsis taiwanensis TaxID=342230 RepID=UPI0004ACD211|nr:hypothetical protein [Amycolatopsis taiwanensis]
MAGESITRDGQLEWRGTLLGATTPYRWRDLEGWLDLPDVRDGDVAYDNVHGYQPGQLLVERRTITYTFVISGDAEDFAAAQRTLRAATAPTENPVEEPLVIQLAGLKSMVHARVVRRSIPVPPNNASGYSVGAIQWRATNPRILHLPQQTPSTTPPAPGGGGLVFPLVFPLVFGSAQAGGELVLTNTGNAPAQPVWRITGPCTGPVITNADTGAQLAFDPTYVLPAGQSLKLSTEDRAVLLDSGVSRSNVMVTRGWFTLPVGVTRVRFDSTDHQGTLQCLYYHTSQ